MATLSDQLLNETIRPLLVDDCCKLLDAEVKRKKGFKAMAIKTAYATVKAIKRGFVKGVVEALLDEWVGKLEPYYADYLAGAPGTFADYAAGRADAIAQSLIEVTDERAKTTKHKTAKKLYLKLRGGAMANVVEAVPRLAEVVEGHLNSAAA